MKKWNIGKPDEKISKKLMAGSNLTSLCADILTTRGITDLSEAARLIDVAELENPFKLKDMDKAVSLINEAIEMCQKICVYGDYDCDGVTSTVMLYSYLECIGADVWYYIPERTEGYGLSQQAVQKIAADGTDMIITVDNGISAVDQAKLIKELDMKLIITDHHQPGDILPQADAIINPHQKDCQSSFKMLCGAGIALKLIAALDGGEYETALEQFGDLAAIGTIADIVSITGENRYIVKSGIQYIENTERCGLIELMKISGLMSENAECKKVTSTAIAFSIAPRLNAAGRFGSPKQAFDILTCDDPDEAVVLAEHLNELNNERKSAEKDIIQQIFNQINENPKILSARVLVFRGDGWHHGVIGIVAARILERFGKPCFIMSTDGDELRGSARAFGEFSIFECLTACESVLTKFGGHQSAGGYSLKSENAEDFNELVEAYALKHHENMPVLSIKAEKVLRPEDITIENTESLDILEPFGEGNKQPLFAMTGAVVTEIIPLSSGAHTKLKLNYGGVFVYALMFGTKTSELPISVNEKWDLMVNLNINEYNGKKSVNLNVNDYKKSGINQESYFAACAAYDKYIKNEKLPVQYYERMCPERQELVTVYTLIGEKDTTITTLFMRLNPKLINYCKLRICLDIFNELNLININYSTSEISRVKVPSKVNLDNSNILRELKGKWGMKAAQ